MFFLFLIEHYAIYRKPDEHTKKNAFSLKKSVLRMEDNSTEHVHHVHEHEYSPGNIAYMLTCIAFVWLMIPGVGYFYSGMARSKSALSLIMLSCWSMAIVFVQVKT